MYIGTSSYLFSSSMVLVIGRFLESKALPSIQLILQTK